MKRRAWLLMASAMLCASAGFAAQPAQVAGGQLELNKAIQCTSDDGKVFAGANGGACRMGELAYIDVAFDSDRAGDLADQYCDFTKERPPEAVDVYGVLCYLRTAAPVRAQTRN